MENRETGNGPKVAYSAEELKILEISKILKARFSEKFGKEETEAAFESFTEQVYNLGLRTGYSFGHSLSSGGSAPPLENSKLNYARFKSLEFVNKIFRYDKSPNSNISQSKN